MTPICQRLWDIITQTPRLPFENLVLSGSCTGKKPSREMFSLVQPLRYSEAPIALVQNSPAAA